MSATTTPLQAVIFDVDGTLAETEEAHRIAFNDAFREFGLNWHWSQTDYARLLKTTGGKERIRAFMTTLDTLPESAQNQDDFIARLHAFKTTLYTTIIKSGVVSLRPGIAQLIDQCRAANMRMAIATTTSHPNVVTLIEATLADSGGMTLFEVISSGDMVAHKKPAPDIYLKALAGLQLAPAHCLALEDSRNGLASARAANIPTLITPSIYTADEDFGGACLITPTIAALTTSLETSLLSALIACHARTSPNS